jgi:hypothetical protein
MRAQPRDCKRWIAALQAREPPRWPAEFHVRHQVEISRDDRSYQ